MPRKNELSAAAQYETEIISGAEEFTTYQHGYRETWKAGGFKTLDDAKGAAQSWINHARATNNPRPVMIYAVKSGHQALVGLLEVTGKWKEAVRK